MWPGVPQAGVLCAAKGREMPPRTGNTGVHCGEPCPAGKFHWHKCFLRVCLLWLLWEYICAYSVETGLTHWARRAFCEVGARCAPWRTPRGHWPCNTLRHSLHCSPVFPAYLAIGFLVFYAYLRDQNCFFFYCKLYFRFLATLRTFIFLMCWILQKLHKLPSLLISQLSNSSWKPFCIALSFSFLTGPSNWRVPIMSILKTHPFEDLIHPCPILEHSVQVTPAGRWTAWVSNESLIFRVPKPKKAESQVSCFF